MVLTIFVKAHWNCLITGSLEMPVCWKVRLVLWVQRVDATLSLIKGDVVMKRRTRINYTPEQKAIIWDRYKQGDSLHDIARMFDRYHSSIMPTIHQTGGYRPPVRKRHRLALSLDEREEISRGLVAKLSIRDIAAKLSRAPSTISREVRRHGGACSKSRCYCVGKCTETKTLQANWKPRIV